MTNKDMQITKEMHDRCNDFVALLQDEGFDPSYVRHCYWYGTAEIHGWVEGAKKPHLRFRIMPCFVRPTRSWYDDELRRMRFQDFPMRRFGGILLPPAITQLIEDIRGE